MQKAHFGSLDLDVLEAFAAVMRHRSVTAAAEAIGASQPVLSQRLRRLRAIVGDPLFVRTPKGMLPTSRAERMAQAVETALAVLRADVADRPTFDPRTAEHRFTVLMTGFGSALVVPTVIAALKERAPNVRLHVRSVDANVHALLADGSADVAFGILSAPETGFERMPLYADSMRLLRRRAAPPSRRWAVVEGRQFPVQLEERIVQHDRDAEIVLRTDSVVSLPAIIAETDLQVVLTRRLAEAYAKRYPLRIDPPPFPTPEFTVGLTWHERRTHDPAQRWFRELIAEPYRKT